MHSLSDRGLVGELDYTGILAGMLVREFEDCRGHCHGHGHCCSAEAE